MLVPNVQDSLPIFVKYLLALVVYLSLIIFLLDLVLKHDLCFLASLINALQSFLLFGLEHGYTNVQLLYLIFFLLTYLSCCDDRAAQGASGDP